MNRLTSRWISRRIEFSGDAEIVVRRWAAAWVGTEGAQMRRLAVPMMILYLLGVLAAWLFGGQRARKAATSSALTITNPPA